MFFFVLSDPSKIGWSDDPYENHYDCKDSERNGALRPGSFVGSISTFKACVLRRTMLSIPNYALLCAMLITHHFTAAVILAANHYTALINSHIRTLFEIALSHTFRQGVYLYLRHSYSHWLLLLLHHLLLILHHARLLHLVLLLGLSTRSDSHRHSLLVELLLLLHLHLHLHLLLLCSHHLGSHHHAWLLLHSWLLHLLLLSGHHLRCHYLNRL